MNTLWKTMKISSLNTKNDHCFVEDETEEDENDGRISSEDESNDSNEINFEEALKDSFTSSSWKDSFTSSSCRRSLRCEIETPFFRSSKDVSTSEFKYDIMNNVCICMIDIAGFSTWCSNHHPNIIARAMVSYNDWICHLIRKYQDIKKVELVGDCCMVISGIHADNFDTLILTYLNMIRFAVDMIEDITTLKNIFKSKNIGIRIGIHVSDVIGIYLNNPYKYQLFGNDINVCSRLENSAITNTIHVSEKTLMCLQNACDAVCGPCSRCIKGNAINQSYKGIGFKTSYQLFLKQKSIYLINFSDLFKKRFTEKHNTHTYKYEIEYKDIYTDIDAFKYIAIIINISNSRAIYDEFEEVSKIINHIKKNTQFKQTCILIVEASLYENTRKMYEYEFEYILNYEEHTFDDTIRSLLLRISNEFNEKKRGSLDLTIYDHI
jgi:class 3 adenylate cyclase